jgi:hypothetical protein
MRIAPGVEFRVKGDSELMSDAAVAEMERERERRPSHGYSPPYVSIFLLTLELGPECKISV